MVLELLNVFKLPGELLKMWIPGSQPRESASVHLKQVQESAFVIKSPDDSAAGATRPHFERHSLERVTFKFTN